MTQSELIKALKYVKNVEIGSWDMVLTLVELIQGGAQVLEKEYTDNFKRGNPTLYPLDLSKVRTWTTFENCVSIILQFNEANELIASIKLYNGDNMDGFRTSLRFTAKIRLLNSILNRKKVKERVSQALNYEARWAYEDHLKKVQKEWEDEFKKRILTD